MAFGRLSICLGLALTGSLAVAETNANSYGNQQRPMNIVPQTERTSDPEVPWQRAPLDEPILGADQGNPDQVGNFLKIYQLVVVIDKGTRPQTLTAYYDANHGQGEQDVVMGLDHVKVSTGDEKTECEGTLTSETDSQGHQWYGQAKAYWHHTEDGFYVPHDDRGVIKGGNPALDIDHNSSDFDAPMPYAVGFDKESSTYTHIGESDTKWGTPQSHGCVRMQPSDAVDLFTMVAMTGGPINTSDAYMNAHCPPKTPDCVISESKQTAMHNYLMNMVAQKFPGARTEGGVQIAALESRLPQLKPNDANDPRLAVPLMDRSGNVLKNTDGSIKRTPPGKGFSTLYIVKDSRYKESVFPNPDGEDPQAPSYIKTTAGGSRVNTLIRIPPEPTCDPNLLAQLNQYRAQKNRWQLPKLDGEGKPVVGQDGRIQDAGFSLFGGGNSNFFQNSNNGSDFFSNLFGGGQQQQPPPRPQRPVKGGRTQ